LISENTEEPAGSAVNQICWTMVAQVEEVQAKYSTLFRLTHPRREWLEHEGWPVEAEQCA